MKRRVTLLVTCIGAFWLVTSAARPNPEKHRGVSAANEIAITCATLDKVSCDGALINGCVCFWEAGDCHPGPRVMEGDVTLLDADF